VEYAKGVKGEIDQRPRRFYEHVSVAKGEAGWGVMLDGRPLRTPEKNMLAFPTEALAAVIADEWRAQAERIDFPSMFNTRLANVAIDRTPAARAALAAEAAKYAETDLVCHFAEGPGALRERQEAGWSPLRDWAAEELGVRLAPADGILAKPQPKASLEAVRAHAEGLDDLRLTGLLHGVGLLGSAVLGLAVERGRISAAEAYELSRIDEAFQASQWGEDAEAVRRADRHRAEARALDIWFGAIR
jgi:chaperone required for assembly of F1-ATPase